MAGGATYYGHGMALDGQGGPPPHTQQAAKPRKVRLFVRACCVLFSRGTPTPCYVLATGKNNQYLHDLYIQA